MLFSKKLTVNYVHITADYKRNRMNDNKKTDDNMQFVYVRAAGWPVQMLPVYKHFISNRNKTD